MRDKDEFYDVLAEISGRPFDRYQKIAGDFDFSRYVLKINEVQPAVDADPTLLVLRAPQSVAGFPPHLFSTPIRRTALEDVLTRQMGVAIDARAGSRRLSVARPSPQILPRTSMVVTEEFVEARVYVSLPSRDGRVDGELATRIFFEELPQVATAALVYAYLDPRLLDRAVSVMEDADFVRQRLAEKRLVAFVADGAILPRNGQTGAPLPGAVPFESPAELRVDFALPSGRTVYGMGVPAGVTAIIGGAKQGKSTLLSAIREGVYNHAPGDGRELVVTLPDTVQVDAEPGRSVQRVDISGFYSELPGGVDTAAFDTPCACVATSQAAGVIEALEAGAGALLFDEDTSAPSLFGADAALQQLAGHSSVALRPLASQLRPLWQQRQISSVVATATCSQYLAQADTVILLEDFRPRHATAAARELIAPPPAAAGAPLVPRDRSVIAATLDPSRGRDDHAIRTRNHLIEFGRDLIDLAALPQLVDPAQVETIGLILYYAKLRYMEEGTTLSSVLDFIDRDLGMEGLECLSRELRGDLARPRRFEVAAALNRLRSLRVRSV